MDDLKKLALQLLDVEKRFLLEEKEEYRAAVVVVVIPEGRYSEEVQFDSEEEKIVAYAAIVDRAKEDHATAIITINSSFLSSDANADYRWGDLERRGAQRAITLTLSGPSLEPCSLSLPFSVENDSVNVGEVSDFQPALMGLLPGWP